MSREAKLGVLIALAAAALYLAPFARHIDRPGGEDWPIWDFYEVVARKSVVEHGEFPLWNPYSCGGAPFHAHPFTRALAPIAPLHWLVNHAASLRIEAWLLLGATAVLAYLLARRHGIGRAGAAVAATVAAFSGQVVARLSAGHLGLLQIPWVVLALYARTLARPGRAVAAGALALALALFSGGSYLAVCAALMVAFEAAWDAAAIPPVRRPGRTPRRRARPLALAAATLALAVALAAIKVVPTADFMRDFPRPTEGGETFAPGGPVRAWLTGWYGYVTGMPYGWHEYHAYVGWLPLALALAGLALAPRRAARPVALAALLGIVAAGDFAPWSPWSLLHRLPVIDSMRIPSRFLIVAAIPLGQAAGIGLDVVVGALSAARPRLAHAALAVAPVLLLDYTLAGWPSLAGTFVRPTRTRSLAAAPRDGAFHQTRGTPETAAVAARANLGTIRCAEGVPYPRSRRICGAPQRCRGEVWMMGGGTARLARFSPNVWEVDVDVRAPRGATLVVNQRFDPRWRSSVGTVRDWEHSLTVSLPPGARRVRLAYRPCAPWWGAGVSVAAAAVAISLARRRRVPAAR